MQTELFVVQTLDDGEQFLLVHCLILQETG